VVKKTLELDLINVSSAMEGLFRQVAQSAEHHDSRELNAVAGTIMILTEKLLDLSEVAAGMQYRLRVVGEPGGMSRLRVTRWQF